MNEQEFVEKLDQQVFGFLYEVDEEEKHAFGDNWCGPNSFKPWVPTLVAHYPLKYDDGREVNVYCTAGPARFYTIKAIGNNSYQINTGTLNPELTSQIAKEIARGMLDFSKLED